MSCMQQHNWESSNAPVRGLIGWELNDQTLTSPSLTVMKYATSKRERVFFSSTFVKNESFQSEKSSTKFDLDRDLDRFEKI